MKLLLTLTSVLALSVPALADHAVDNAADTARAAYRAADDAENLAWYANRDAGPIHIDTDEPGSELELAVTPEDHRGDTLRQLGQSANSLHYSLSDLYRAARAASGGFGPQDHRGDDIRDAFRTTQYHFNRLQQSYRNLSRYRYNRNIDQLYRSVEYSFSRLQWTVLGGGIQ